MNIFLSYASASRPVAEELCHRLQAAGHEVFFDREDLPAGQSYDDHIRSAIERCSLFIFLVTPDAVADGRYTRTELKIAARRWPTPGLHVLPVLAEPTPLHSVPAYLRALNLLQPEGNLAAEVLMEVRDRAAQLEAAAPAPPPAPPIVAGSHFRTLTLRFEQSGDATFLTLPEAGRLPLALDAPALERTLWAGAADLGDRARRDGAALSLRPAAAGARSVGQALHQAVFGSPAGAALAAQLRSVDAQRGEGVRVVVDTTAAPALARLPWEFLYNPAQDDFVFSDRMKPLVRRLDVDAPPPTLAVNPPLRLLVAVAAPNDRPDLQVGAELAHLDDALAELTASGRLATQRLARTTLERLDDALLRHRPHLLHFIGHGDFDGDEGRLLLEDETGAAAPIAGRQLAVLLRNHLDSLRLVFLNSCMGAAAARHDAFGGVAQSLLRRGLPAVVAMQFPVDDADALTLARHFYRYLAAGQPVDSALNSARAFMVARGDGVAWGAPALYMNAQDGKLFDLGAGAPPMAAALPEAPPAPPVAPVVAPPAGPSAAPPARGAGRGRWIGAGVLLAVLLVAAIGWLGREPAPDMAPLPAPIVVAPPSPDVGTAAEQRAAEKLAAAEMAIQSGALDVAQAQLGELAAMAPLPAPLQARAQRLEQLLRLMRQQMTTGSVEAGAAGGVAPMQYRIRRGDTLWGLAGRFLGDPARWRELWQRHQQAAAIGLVPAIADPDRLRIGQPLLLPTDPETGAGVRYHVVPGDTLSGIARRIYGDPARWPQIQRDNGLADPHRIVPRQVLHLRPPA